MIKVKYLIVILLIFFSIYSIILRFQNINLTETELFIKIVNNLIEYAK